MVTSGKPGLIRRYNRDLIRALILEKGPVTKVELARLSGASVPTVNKIVNQLEKDGMICVIDEDTGSVGRKAASYVVNKDAGYYIVFFIQNQIVQAGLANNHGEILHEERFTPDTNSIDAVNGTVFHAIELFKKEIPGEKLKAIGVGIPGIIDPENKIVAIPTVPCWEGVALKSILEERYHVSVFLENDVKLMTVGAYKRGYSEKYRNMVFLYISEGLGAGIIINGRLYKGANNFAGEYGFMIPDFEKSVSHPESTGDLEYKLRPLIEKKIRNGSFSAEENELFSCMLSGIITNFTAVLNPDVISVCSPYLEEKDLGQVKERTRQRIPDYCIPELDIIPDENYGINGVVELCMTGIHTKLSLIDETGL